MNSTKLLRKKVIAANGTIIGEVEALDVNTENWNVEGLQVGLTNDAAAEIGFKRPALSQIVILVPPKLIASVGDVITLNEVVGKLKDLVKYLGFR
ncbi:MAG: PRC-barrel domain-containing protein [Candidatus Bathyarchaeia archaeon]